MAQRPIAPWLFAALLIPLLISFAAAWQAIDSTAQEVEQELMRSSVEDRHVVIEQFLLERKSMLKTWFFDNSQFVDNPQLELAQFHERLQALYGDFRSLALSDAQGQLLAWSGFQLNKSPLVDNTEWFQTAIREGEYLGPIVRDKNHAVYFTYALAREHEGIKQVMAVTIHLERLSAILEEFALKDAGGTYIVDPRSGKYLSRPYYGGEPLQNVNQHFNWGRKHEHIDYEHHGTAEVGLGSYTNPVGTAVNEAHCCINNGEWLVVVEKPLSAMGQHTQPIKSRLLLTAIACLLVTLVLIAVVIKQTRANNENI